LAAARKGLASEFRKFAVKGKVVDLAVGVIVGAAFEQINRRRRQAPEDVKLLREIRDALRRRGRRCAAAQHTLADRAVAGAEVDGTLCRYRPQGVAARAPACAHPRFRAPTR
jgi:hypothetical protein